MIVSIFLCTSCQTTDVNGLIFETNTCLYIYEHSKCTKNKIAIHNQYRNETIFLKSTTKKACLRHTRFMFTPCLCGARVFVLLLLWLHRL